MKSAAAIVVLLSTAGQCLAEAPLREEWRVALSLHGPTNVVVGRLDGQPRYCVQGTFRQGTRAAAAVELRDAAGQLVWRDAFGKPDLDFTPGAYVHWLDGQRLDEPMVVYAFCPAADGHRGGARLLRAGDGTLVRQLENRTRFGNNNSVVGDLDGDGTPEFVYADQKTLVCYDLPDCKERWRVAAGVLFCWSLPALCDLNANGRPALVFGSEYNNADGSSSMIALDPAGKQLWRSDGHAEDLGSTPVFWADVDGDGSGELLKVGLDLVHRRKQQWNHLYVFDPKGTLQERIKLGFTGIAIGDMDGDGVLEGVGLTNTRDGGNNGRREIRCIDLATGQVRWTRPVERAYLDTNSPLMADVDGDGRLEAIVGTGNPSGYGRLPNSRPWGDLYVVAADGTIRQRLELPGWPVNLAFCDVDDDGLGELAVVIDGQPGWLALYRTRAATTRRDWPTPFGNAARSGTLGANPDGERRTSVP